VDYVRDIGHTVQNAYFALDFGKGDILERFNRTFFFVVTPAKKNEGIFARADRSDHLETIDFGIGELESIKWIRAFGGGGIDVFVDTGGRNKAIGRRLRHWRFLRGERSQAEFVLRTFVSDQLKVSDNDQVLLTLFADGPEFLAGTP
jgi:hypothetical protein